MTVSTFPITIVRSSRRRTVAIHIKLNGEVTVLAPNGVREQQILDVVHQKNKWVMRHLDRINQRKGRGLLTHLIPGGWFYFRGKEITIVSGETDDGLFVTPSQFSISCQGDLVLKIREALFKEAQSIILPRVQELARQFQMVPQRTRLSTAKHAWGSCSGKGVVSIHWALVMAPPVVLDDVIIHELCHLVHPNHSDRFWNLLKGYTATEPDSKAWLKMNHHELNWAV